jgi:hypothetical protein
VNERVVRAGDAFFGVPDGIRTRVTAVKGTPVAVRATTYLTDRAL